MTHLDGGFRYGPAEHHSYITNGYWIKRHCLTSRGLRHYQQELDNLLDTLHEGHSPEEIISAHQFLPWLFELASEPAILDMIEQQIGPNIVLWSTHLLCKPPLSGKEVPWHQDAPYWNVGGPFPGAVWITLDDVTIENGAMSVLPGWHNRGTLPRRIAGSDFFNQEIDPAALPPDVQERAVTYLVPAGTMAVHDPMIPHTSMPNRSSRWRRVIILRYMAASGRRGEKVYSHPVSGHPMPREYYLMRGVDTQIPASRSSPVLPSSRRGLDPTRLQLPFILAAILPFILAACPPCWHLPG